ncbi:hypothetical protein WR25_15608 [Diploscapter pachys]|uniref:PSMD12/CSN4-like N-terminal domain-containing protein n=1 Tax=Diploscapter pachys TaxID=2018661 RepID=A0A2A2M0Q6_9BILA|nr:hypothetical protein WR25_15608 [Diploscapter pachys]
MENREAAVVDPVEAGQKIDKELVNHLASKANDGRLVKTDVDYTKEVDAAVSVAEKLLKENNLQGAIDALVPWEKKTRLSYDWKNNARIQTKIVGMCHLTGNWTMLCDMILALVKKRLAIKLALAKMIRAAFALIDKTPDEETKFRLIDTLRIATANKIYVEVERARLTQMVADRKWKEGKKQEAAQMMLELHVETYSTMEIKERIRFLCEQIRMALAIGDVTRAAVISKKVSTRYFDTHHESTSVQALKVIYYMLLIKIGQVLNEHAEVSRHYRCLYETPILANSKEQATSKLVTKFLADELISWNNDIKTNYEALLFQDSAEGKGVRVFANNDEGTARWTTFKTRVAEHSHSTNKWNNCQRGSGQLQKYPGPEPNPYGRVHPWALTTKMGRPGPAP